MLPDSSPIQQHTEMYGQLQSTSAKRVICTSMYYLGEYLIERHEIDYSDYPHLMPRFVLDDATCTEITSVRTVAHLPTASERRLFYFASLGSCINSTAAPDIELGLIFFCLFLMAGTLIVYH